jgi:hypothetical protein
MNPAVLDAFALAICGAEACRRFLESKVTSPIRLRRTALPVPLPDRWTNFSK